MINWKTIAVTTGALMILPVSTFAVNSAAEVNNVAVDNMDLFAQGPMFRHRRGKGERMPRILEQLDLTPEQSQQIEAIKEQSQTAAQDIKEQLRTQRQELRSLLAGDTDIEQIREQHQEAQLLRQQLSNDRFETMLEIREILTLEQRARALELMEQHHNRRFDS